MTRLLSGKPTDQTTLTAATRGLHPRVAGWPVPTCQSEVTMSSIAYVTSSVESAADERSLGAEAHPGLGCRQG
jgi:hypothetical protein